jgi:hypothetical protein
MRAKTIGSTSFGDRSFETREGVARNATQSDGKRFERVEGEIVVFKSKFGFS